MTFNHHKISARYCYITNIFYHINIFFNTTHVIACAHHRSFQFCERLNEFVSVDDFFFLSTCTLTVTIISCVYLIISLIDKLYEKLKKKILIDWKVIAVSFIIIMKNIYVHHVCHK